MGGDPKGVIKTAANLSAAAQAIGRRWASSADDRVLCTMPLLHGYGFDFGLLVALANGATLFLEDEVAPKRIAKLLREQNIDFFAGQPGAVRRAGRVPTDQAAQDQGRALPAQRARRCPPASPRASTSGTASACSPATTPPRRGRSPSTARARSPRRSASAFEGVELRVAGAKGERLTAGEIGPIWVRSKTLSMLAVPKMHLPKRDGGVAIGGVDGDGWHRTGDLGQLDKNGRLTITGREDDVVKVDGKRVALGEVEGCLEAFPKIKAAQARVITDPTSAARWSWRAWSAASMCGAEDIIDHCARNLAPYKVPRRIEFCESF